MAPMTTRGMRGPAAGRRAVGRLVGFLVLPLVVLGVIAVHGACMEAVAGRSAGADTVVSVVSAGADTAAALPGSERVPGDPPCHDLGETDRVVLPEFSFPLLIALLPLGFGWRPSPAASPWRALRTPPRAGAGARSPIALCVIRI
jgi:hypothetical protein